MDKDTNSFNLAAIDIGSNAARLLIKSVTRNDDGTITFQKLQFVRFPLRLGLDVFHSGAISPERHEKFLRMIKAFRQLMIIYDVIDFRAYATSALRDATNGRKVLKDIKKRTGVNIEIISGDEEARTIYDNHIEKLLLASASEGNDGKSFLYVDVGGGSTEVSFISQGQMVWSHSFNIGTLRMLAGVVGLEAINDMCDKIVQMTQPATPVTIIGSGGNINKLFRLVPKQLRGKDGISVEQLHDLYSRLSSLSVAERIREFDLRPDRADVIVPAAQVFIAIAKAVNASDVAVPTVGLADGIINELCSQL